MAWFALIIAGLFETFGVAMMNQYSVSKNWKPLVLLILGFCASLFLLEYSMNTIPMGTAYAIWTGFGVVGGTVVGMLFYGESRSWKRILFITIILCSSVGLKMVS
ncbi:QacE family quaternary ammonium compound efflux SMR transporter [Lysinibacillus yapensis]|uniref:QacE family quaternary ammonium compound efflux SMR transporter n=1 Tax=Ureibacillus yapensis TaxID=2304605 RepID=A0A396S6T6_9BACL|nr:multidrug efflux SMR transporter [Lysinibacillus yapensis]RHW35829.1 QacE family quaternary ammonium compound efflux SMR transporter [Lysinibacillus yapensis]